MPASAAKSALAPKGLAEIFHSPAKLTLVLCLALAAITLALYSPAPATDSPTTTMTAMS